MILTLNYTNFTNISPILIDNTDINKIVISNKVFFHKKHFKYFIGYKDTKYIGTLFTLFLLKMSAYRRDFDETKHMSLSMKNIFIR